MYWPNYSQAFYDDSEAFTDIFSSVFSIFVVIWDIISIAAISRTKRTPRSARFLTIALISFEATGLFFLSVAKYVKDKISGCVFISLLLTLGVLVFTTMFSMAVERLAVLTSTSFHDFHFRYKRIRHFVIFVWSAEIIIMILLPFSKNSKTLTDDRQWWYGIYLTCQSIMIALLSLSIVLCAATVILVREKLPTSTGLPRPSRKIKATKTLILYLLFHTVIVLYFIFNLIFPARGQQFKIYHVSWLLCCIFDPLAYVFWFRESRLELLKLATYFFPSLDKRVEHMRYDIFNITTYKQKRISRLAWFP